MSSGGYFDSQLDNGSPDAWWPSRDLVVKGLVTAFSLLAIHRIGLIIYRVWFHPLSKFPGPKHLAATNIIWQWKSYVRGSWQWELRDLHLKYGPIVRIGSDRLDVDGSIGWAQIYGHKGAKQEFSKLPNFFFPDDHNAIIGARKDDHRRMRRHLGHAFSDSALHEQEGLIKKYVDLLSQRLGEHADAGDAIDIVSWLNYTTFDIIGDLSFGDSFHSLDNNGYHPWVKSIFQGIRGDNMSRFARTYPLVGAFIVSLIGHRDMRQGEDNRKYAHAKARARMSLGTEPQDGRRDFMTYLMKTNKDGVKGFSDTEVVEHAPLLVVAGSETTATALSGLFFYMGQTPRVYETLVSEVRNAFSNESEIDLKSAARLEYLQACLNEALRMYPPASDTPPRISPGAEIDGKFVPAGYALAVSQLSTFYNPANFHDPESFRPERWLQPSHPLYDSVFANDNRAAFKPFSAGPRDCLGKNLAYSEMRLIMSRILCSFDFKLEHGQLDWHMSQKTFGIWDKGPLNVTMIRRKDAA